MWVRQEDEGTGDSLYYAAFVVGMACLWLLRPLALSLFVWASSMIMLSVLWSRLLRALRRRPRPFCSKAHVTVRATGLNIDGLGFVPWEEITHFSETGDQNGVVLVNCTGPYALYLSACFSDPWNSGKAGDLLRAMDVYHVRQLSGQA
ncbi:hypothetical protein ACFFLM_14240 [Deinococcus oregonensis]|uniref:YcxB-like protein domain-containing protein n=1 Tax=Deinococcus oregonensis TaxID=1805970 RepID=A0ABV6B403_9DEIO